ncbi:MAG: hypothetical protein QOJ25_18 [Solirubrobacteraceae bacterium]|jgi:hypothetical protein|nr:hypothetical protein [Solirubrobacteraceae bacterium]
MPSLYCARCGLRTQLTAASLLLENCPRCMGRSGTVTPLVVAPPFRWDVGEQVASDAKDVTASPARPTAPPARP